MNTNNLLHVIESCKQLVEFLKNKYKNNHKHKHKHKHKNDKRVTQLVNWFHPTKIIAGGDSAYCKNKDIIYLVLGDKHDMLFVALHLLTTIATKSVGHTHEFWKNFKFILLQAEEAGIYQSIPQKYGGVLYDLSI
jgi:hypothetical protein